MKKRIPSLFLPLAAILASCGGSSTPASSQISSQQPSSAPPSSLPSQSSVVSSQRPTSKVTVPFWTTFGQSNGIALQNRADEFAKIIKQAEGVDVEIVPSYQGGYGDIKEKVGKSWTAANTPTLAIAYPDHVADYLASETEPGQHVVNIEPYMNDATIGFGKQSYLGDAQGKDDFVEAFIDEGTHYIRQGTYSLPFMKSTEVMFYNFDAVKRAMPYYDEEIAMSDDKIRSFVSTMTWDQLLAFSEKALEHKDQVAPKMKFPIWYDSDENLFISKMFQEEIPYCSILSSGHGNIDFASGENRTKAEAMVTSLVQAREKGLITTKGIEEGKYGSDSFTKEECIFEIGSSGGTGYTAPEGETFTPGIAAVPASNNNPLYVSQGPTITFLHSTAITEQENKWRLEYAWKFAKYITNPESNVYLCIYGSEGYLPVRYSAYETPEYLSFLEEGELFSQTAKILINEIDGNYFNSAVFQGSAELRTQCGGIVTAALLKKDSVSNLFDKGIENALKQFGNQ